jgi:hypothetical protein
MVHIRRNIAILQAESELGIESKSRTRSATATERKQRKPVHKYERDHSVDGKPGETKKVKLDTTPAIGRIHMTVHMTFPKWMISGQLPSGSTIYAADFFTQGTVIIYAKKDGLLTWKKFEAGESGLHLMGEELTDSFAISLGDLDGLPTQQGSWTEGVPDKFNKPGQHVRFFRHDHRPMMERFRGNIALHLISHRDILRYAGNLSYRCKTGRSRPSTQA